MFSRSLLSKPEEKDPIPSSVVKHRPPPAKSHRKQGFPNRQDEKAHKKSKPTTREEESTLRHTIVVRSTRIRNRGPSTGEGCSSRLSIFLRPQLLIPLRPSSPPFDEKISSTISLIHIPPGGLPHTINRFPAPFLQTSLSHQNPSRLAAWLLKARSLAPSPPTHPHPLTPRSSASLHSSS